jgi:hypothetical protein
MKSDREKNRGSYANVLLQQCAKNTGQVKVIMAPHDTNSEWELYDEAKT